MGRSSSIERSWHLAAVKWNGWGLISVPEQYTADRAIVLAAVKQDGLLLVYAAEECKAEAGGVRPYMDLLLPSYAGYLRQPGPRAGHDLL
eukprot:34366-Amphidinium_carterae.1